MREIKFRAWDKKFNVMQSPENFYNEYISAEGKVIEIEEWSDYGGGGYHSNDVSEDRILMQFTGLLDRNGKEIYEGDIVTARQQSNTATFAGYVHFRNCQYWVNYIGYESYYLPLIQLHNAEYVPIEVIGNIYEHPHLLEANT